MDHLNWTWLAIELTIVPAAAWLAALPIWLKEQPIFGNIAGTIVIFGAAFALIMREHIELTQMSSACIDQGFTCFPIAARVHALRDLLVHRAFRGHRAVHAQPARRAETASPRLRAGMAPVGRRG